MGQLGDEASPGPAVLGPRSLRGWAEAQWLVVFETALRSLNNFAEAR